MSQFTVTIVDNGDTVFTQTFDGPVEFGRKQQGDPAPYSVVAGPGRRRMVVATETQRTFPRRACVVNADATRITLENLHDQNHVLMVDIADLAPRQRYSTENELAFKVSENCRVKIRLRSEGDTAKKPPQRGSGQLYRTLTSLPAIPSPLGGSSVPAEFPIQGAQPASAESFVQLLRAALEVVQLSAASNSFFEAAVRAAASSLNLDRGLVLLKEGSGWRAVAEFVRGEQKAPAQGTWSKTLLDRLVSEKRTVVFDPSSGEIAGQSLANIESIVASPMLDERGEIVGVLYGERWLSMMNHTAIITDIDAAMFEILTGAIAGGIARQREARARVQLEQFFSKNVAEKLQSDPDLLAGRDVLVTVLFCDIRGFSSVTERLGPGSTIDWINDVLTELSDCVLHEDGVVVDYVGDEIFAMWGAPGEQPDHAARTIRSALGMQRRNKILRARWSEVLSAPFSFGIGLSTGTARVGNTGSKLKFKYGPLGNVVNLGSRVQGATKFFRVNCMATEATVSAAGYHANSRLLATASVVGIHEPTALYEIVDEVTAEWRELRDEYQEALRLFEASEFSRAAAILGSLVTRYPDDWPTLLLLGRTVTHLTTPRPQFSPVLTLIEK